MNNFFKSGAGKFILASISALVTGVMASYIFYALTERSAQLVYEIVPAAVFENQDTHLSIINIKISNAGNKEAEEVSGLISFPDSIKVLQQRTEPKPKSLPIHASNGPSSNTRFDMPILNPGEQAYFSFLTAATVDKNDIQVELRGKGIRGKEFSAERNGQISTTLLLGTLGMFLLTLGLVIFIFLHQRKVIGYHEKILELTERKANKQYTELSVKYNEALAALEQSKRKRNK